MKNNSISLRSLLGTVLALLLMVIVFESCKKDDTPAAVPVDKSKLKARLDSDDRFLRTGTGGRTGWSV